MNIHIWASLKRSLGPPGTSLLCGRNGWSTDTPQVRARPLSLLGTEACASCPAPQGPSTENQRVSVPQSFSQGDSGRWRRPSTLPGAGQRQRCGSKTTLRSPWKQRVVEEWRQRCCEKSLATSPGLPLPAGALGPFAWDLGWHREVT